MPTSRTVKCPKPIARPKNFGEPERMLITSQLDSYLANSPGPVRWLDLLCRNADVTSLIDLASELEGKLRRNREVHYQAVETTDFFGQISAGLKQKIEQQSENVRVHTGSLVEVMKGLQGKRFEIVTLINMLHELPLSVVPTLFLDLTALCSETGALLVRDESVLHRKAAATPWISGDIQKFLHAFVRRAGIPTAPVVRINSDTAEKESAWYFTLFRKAISDFDLDKVLKGRHGVEEKLQRELLQIFLNRKELTHNSLEETVKLLTDAKAQRGMEGKDEGLSIAQMENAVDMLSRNFWAYDAEIAALKEHS